MKIIAFSGKRESGKTTCAKAVQLVTEAVRMSFAAALRGELVAMGYHHNLIHDKPTPDPVRALLVAHGMCRRYCDENYWVRQMWKALGQARSMGVPLAVIDDLRFWNEAEQLRASGATLVRVSLTDPLFRQQYIPGVDDDKSETDLDQWPDWDFEIKAKKGDIAGLEAQVEDIVRAVDK